MKNEILRQKRINQQLSELPFSSRTPRIPYTQRAVGNNNYDQDLIRIKRSKKKLRNNFYEGETSERYYNGPPFSLNCSKYEDDYDTIEAHARFCKAKAPGQDIDESEKMHFYAKMKSDNYVSHFKKYFDKQKESYELNHDIILDSNNKSSKSKKTSINLKKIQGAYPSFCRPYSERVKEFVDKETNQQKYQIQSDCSNNDKNILNYYSCNLSDNEEEYIKTKENIETNPINIDKSKKKIKKNEYTPNIHVTRRVRSYYLANNMDLPDFLERIDPVPLRYDKIIHYHPDPD